MPSVRNSHASSVHGRTQRAQATSTRPRSSASTVRTARATSHSARACTSASVRHWPAPRPGSCSNTCWRAHGGSRPRPPGGGCPACWCGGWRASRCGSSDCVGDDARDPQHEIDLRAAPIPRACDNHCHGVDLGSSTSPGRAWPASQSLKRPANPRSGRSALVMMPGGAATTDLIAFSAGIPVTVMPIDAKLVGSDRSTPGLGKIMCLL